jgi:hypothetical protein
MLVANVLAVWRESEPVHRESLPAVRRESAPVRRESSPVARQISAIKRVVRGVSPGIVVAQKKDSAIALPDSFKDGHRFGEVMPMVNTTPDVAEIQVLTMHCSHVRRAATQTFARNRLGDQLRLVDNYDSKSFLRLAGQNGVRISEGKKAMRSLDEFFWGGWQCPLCHHGKIAGAQTIDWFQCFCGELSCGSSVVLTRNGVSTCICGACNHAGVLNGSVDFISGTRHTSRRI